MIREITIHLDAPLCKCNSIGNFLYGVNTTWFVECTKCKTRIAVPLNSVKAFLSFPGSKHRPKNKDHMKSLIREVLAEMNREFSNETSGEKLPESNLPKGLMGLIDEV